MSTILDYPHNNKANWSPPWLERNGDLAHLLFIVLQAKPPVRTVPGDEGQVLRWERQRPEHQQGRTVTSCPVHQQGPAPLHPEQGYGPAPTQRREAAVQHRVTRELSAAGGTPHHPAHKLDEEKDGDGLLEPVEAWAWDELWFHHGAIFLVEYAVHGAKEEGNCEQDGGDQSEVEAGGDALIQPGMGDGGVGLTVALYKPHGCSWKRERVDFQMD